VKGGPVKGGPAAVLAALALGACAPSTRQYPVIAEAELTAIADDITGPIEILGANAEDPDDATLDMEDFVVRTFAAYRVHLPDAAPRHAVIYNAESCQPTDPRPKIFADLQTIRRVGDETHFFADDIRVNGRTTSIDTETAQAVVSLNPASPFVYVLGKIAVVQAPDLDGVPGAWLACGAFTKVERCVGCAR
jgi:hypothetical protein